MCRVTILNENGIPVTVEVSREIYQVFVDYEREIERQRKADFRHRDARSWDTCLIFEVSTETLEQTYERIRTLHEIQEALNEFTRNSGGASCSILPTGIHTWRSQKWREAISQP